MPSRVVKRARALLRRGAAEAELDQEVRYHLESQIELNVRAGMSPEEARRAALRDFGGVERAKEECRDARGVRLVEDLWQDLRYCARTLAKRPGFTLVAVLTLALGIGASTAIFSAVNPILFEPLPYPNAERIVSIWDFGAGGAQLPVTFGTLREVSERSRTFDALAVMRAWQPTVTGGEPERLEGQRVSADYFRVLGVLPAVGRGFDPPEDEPGGRNAVVLGDALWRRRFGGDASVVGREIRLDDELYTVVGVMPREFENVASPSAQLWAPLRYDKSLPPESREWGHHLSMIGRLRAGVTIDEARGELDAIARAPVPEFTRPVHASLGKGLMIRSLQDDVTAGVKPALLAVLGAVSFLLLIACVNVTNLLLARGAQRRGEFAMRAALGATRARLVRQMLAESLLLSFAGGALGLLAAQVGVDVLVTLTPAGLPRAAAIGVNGAAFAFAAAVTTLVGLLVGLAPSVHASSVDLRVGVAQSSNRGTGGQRLTRRALVVAEVALALVLLVSAGLLMRSMERLFAVDPGFDTSHLLTMQVQTAGQRFDKETTDRFFAQALEAVRRVPGVGAAGFTSQLPLSGDSDEYGALFEGDPPGSAYNIFRYAVSPGYMETAGIPLRRGRLFDEHDRAGAPHVALISESLAKIKFGDQDPVGRRVHIGPTDRPWFTIVGVVGDVKQVSLAKSQPEAAYIPATQSWFDDRSLSLVVRARGDAAALAPAVRQAIWSVDKDQPVARVATMDDLLAKSAAERRFALVLFEAFGVAALILAAVGIYGLLSGSVAERTREIGIRLALGATRRDILSLVVRQGMKLAGLGVVIGLAGAAAASRALVSLLYGVSRLDPASYLGVVALLAAVSAVACWLPAWRASRVDPSITLRAE
ncbi:MAG TPA: ABC transporter permease [Pyrinomonadaceae bacterium]|nr:ABC transporter permease [Pyrinomonadaceae bacterium]